MAFSVLLPVYRGDDAAFVTRAIRSVTTDQTLPPDELVIVRDGPVGSDIQAALDGVRAGVEGTAVRLVELPVNRGLALALEAGLDACAHEIVARADADDISMPPRFAVQVPMVEDGLDLISAAIVEFSDDEDDLGLVRAWPTDAASIAKLARFQDPFNHPAVVYRRSAVRAAGGYRHLDKMEDYWLFARMIAAGARTGNVAEPLVKYRVGAGAYERRGGRSMLHSELRLQREFRRSGFTTPAQCARNLLVRGVWRVVPTPVRRPIYKVQALLRGRSDAHRG